MMIMKNTNNSTPISRGHLPSLSSHSSRQVLQGDDNMKQAIKDLLIELVKKERMRLTVALSVWRSKDGYSTYEEMATLNKERDLCNSTLKSLTGGE